MESKSDSEISMQRTEEGTRAAERLDGASVSDCLGDVPTFPHIMDNTRPIDGHSNVTLKPVSVSGPTSISDMQPAKKLSKEEKKYVPSKKAMIDPLKMDISKTVAIPLTSSQLSLQCIECHIIFSDLKSKERHLKLSHPAEYEQRILRNALFACYVCDRHFTNSTELMVHQRAHTEKKPFKCPICGQAFKKSSELTHHKKIHFGRDGYACTDCGKPCKTLTLLKYHRRTHTGERPYVCKECGKRFSMPKALQKHSTSHLVEASEIVGGDTYKAQLKKNDGISSIRFTCSICKATFKTTKTRMQHMKNKHNMVPAVNTTKAVPAHHQFEQTAPIITPISVCQPALLQVEPDGPLQKVDANIDTEQIRKLIESLGNVQKVNQVVILGQVPPHAPPVEVQQISELVNPTPQKIDFIQVEQTESKTGRPGTLNDSLEQTIFLEAVSPDGQLHNSSFSELARSTQAATENIGLPLSETEHRIESHKNTEIHKTLEQQEGFTFQSDLTDEIVCQREQNHEQPLILELDSSLISVVLEQTKSVSQNEVSSSSIVPTPGQEEPSDEARTTASEDTALCVPPLTPTIELELAPVQMHQLDHEACACVSSETFVQFIDGCENGNGEEAGSQVPTVNADQADHTDILKNRVAMESCENTEQERSQKLLMGRRKENVDISPLTQNPAAKDSETKTVHKIIDLPVNTMSAQELVKIRKRKPARTFFFQGHIQELVGTLENDGFQFDVKPAKRQRKKPHLPMKLTPQSKVKKNKSQKKTLQDHTSQVEAKRGKSQLLNASEKKTLPLRKSRKVKEDKTVRPFESTNDVKPFCSNQDQQVQPTSDETRKSKVKNQKDAVRNTTKFVTVKKSHVQPVLKKKIQAKTTQKHQSKKNKDTSITIKGQRRGLAKEQKLNMKTLHSPTLPHVTPETLLLLKGHKQPQLKVHKLDPNSASGTPRNLACNSQVDTQQCRGDTSKQIQLRNNTSKSANQCKAGGQKKGGKPRKNQRGLSLLSSFEVSHRPLETMTTKPKNTRKRKAPLNVETEGVITCSNSRRALECKDCGERFSSVALFQKHKAQVHILLSPGLTYNNGNVFEGVSSLEPYQLAKQHEKVIEGIDAAADWDIEREAGEISLGNKERSVTFPALNASPSLSISPSDVGRRNEDVRDKIVTDGQSQKCPGIFLPTQEMKVTKSKRDSPTCVTAEVLFNTLTNTRSFEAGAPLVSSSGEMSQAMRESERPTLGSAESPIQVATDVEIKDLLLEVDLVTVGEQNVREYSNVFQDSVCQVEHFETSDQENVRNNTIPPTGLNSKETPVNYPSLQTVSCSTHLQVVKVEEEEIVAQMKKASAKQVSRRSRRVGAGCQKRNVLSKTALVADNVREIVPVHEQHDCLVVYRKHAGASKCAANDTSDNRMHHHVHSTSQNSEVKDFSANVDANKDADVDSDRVVFEVESDTTCVKEVMSSAGHDTMERAEEPMRVWEPSQCSTLEKIVTPQDRGAVNKKSVLMVSRNPNEGLDGTIERQTEVQEIKVEEKTLEPLPVLPDCQNHQSNSELRTMLVKDESSPLPNDRQATPGSTRIRWNVEQINTGNGSSPLMEIGVNSKVVRDFSPNQCVFYPVKEEEREVLLETAAWNGTLPEQISSNARTRFQNDVATDKDDYPTLNDQENTLSVILSEARHSVFKESQGEADEWCHTEGIHDFLLQSSDEEDFGCHEFPDVQPESEAEAMCYFNKIYTSCPEKPDAISHSLLTSPSKPTYNAQMQKDHDMSREPMDYFSKYFDSDTWLEIAQCTNKLSRASNLVTAREVAQFVGIHIAMGTLKFPNLRLYWEDLTKVPLIAEAMPLAKFLQLSRTLKFASPEVCLGKSSIKEKTQHCETLREAACGKAKVSHRISSLDTETQRQWDEQNDQNQNSQTDPLWRVQPLLNRFKAGCTSLRKGTEYAVDQYPLLLTGKMDNNKHYLFCTTLVGFGGLIMHIDLNLNSLDKEDAVEKMAPRGSMLFLCRQELSTPAMLERLLFAGVHGAGRVGGAKGEIGDEFVSSDGKLILRRSQCGFILSSVGHSYSNMTSLLKNFEKAQMSAQLNRNLQNLYHISPTAAVPMCWPQVVLWYLTDAALVNSWLQYRQDHRSVSESLTLMAFRLEISKALIRPRSMHTSDSVPTQLATTCDVTNETHSSNVVQYCPLPDATTRFDGSGHWPEQLGEGEGGRCCFGDCQRTSRVLCLKCCVFLCISRSHNCFLKFHNQGNEGQT